DGKPTPTAARPACASRWNATSSTATSAASGRRTCPISSITRPTGRPSARRRRKTGGSWIWYSRDKETAHAALRASFRALPGGGRAGLGRAARQAHRRQRDALHRRVAEQDLRRRRGDG